MSFRPSVAATTVGHVIEPQPWIRLSKVTDTIPLPLVVWLQNPWYSPIDRHHPHIQSNSMTFFAIRAQRPRHGNPNCHLTCAIVCVARDPGLWNEISSSRDDRAPFHGLDPSRGLYRDLPDQPWTDALFPVLRALLARRHELHDLPRFHDRARGPNSADVRVRYLLFRNAWRSLQVLRDGCHPDHRQDGEEANLRWFNIGHQFVSHGTATQGTRGQCSKHAQSFPRKCEVIWPPRVIKLAKIVFTAVTHSGHFRLMQLNLKICSKPNAYLWQFGLFLRRLGLSGRQFSSRRHVCKRLMSRWSSGRPHWHFRFIC